MTVILWLAKMNNLTKEDWKPENASLKISAKFAVQGIKYTAEAFTHLLGSIFVLVTALFKQMAKFAEQKTEQKTEDKK